jgi:hypothetical protein
LGIAELYPVNKSNLKYVVVSRTGFFKSNIKDVVQSNDFKLICAEDVENPETYYNDNATTNNKPTFSNYDKKHGTRAAVVEDYSEKAKPKAYRTYSFGEKNEDKNNGESAINNYLHIMFCYIETAGFEPTFEREIVDYYETQLASALAE